MTTALFAVFLGAAGPVPSPAAALLATTSPHRYTHLLLAQAEDFGPSAKPLPPDERAAEEARLADDMDAAHGHAGPNDPDAAAATDSTVTEPSDIEALEADIRKARRHRRHGQDSPAAGVQGDDTGDYGDRYRDANDDEQPPRRRRRQMDWRRRGLRGTPQNKPTEDGHGKAYYLVWGIVDWTAAAGIWTGSLYNTVLALSFWGLATKTGPLTIRERYPSWIDPRSDGLRKTDYRTGAIITTVLGVLLAAGGGYFAWRAGPNLRTYGQLREQQVLELRGYRERVIGGRRGPRRRRAHEPGAEPLHEHHHTLEGTWDRYQDRDADEGSWDRYQERAPGEGTWDRYEERKGEEPGAAEPPLVAPPPAKLEPPQTKYRKGDPAWEAYLEQVRRRAQEHHHELGDEEGRDHGPDGKGPGPHGD